MRRLLWFFEIFCWCAAVILLGFVALVYADRAVYQGYENWRFDRQLEHRPAAAAGFVRGSATAPAFAHVRPPQPVSRSPVPRPQPGSLLGRIEIPRLGIRAMVADGTTAQVLRRAVGHIEGTPLPGEAGNVGLAGHRDTLFRALRRIRKQDVITVTTLHGAYRYQVDSIRIVEPEDVAVLSATAHNTLTLVTCYPFDYIGPAPHRFIVQARQVEPPAVPATAEARSAYRPPAEKAN